MHAKMQNRGSQGFTLLEMALVLAIIGGIVGALLLGKTMIATSRLQTIMTDANSYMIAATNFKQMYLSLPGDMPSATARWGADSACPAGNGVTGTTCNGNGDGKIAGVTGYEYESFRFWQQLNYAGMFPPVLTGLADTAGASAATAGLNVPSGPLKGSGFSVIWWGAVSSTDLTRFPGFFGNVFIFGASDGNNPTDNPIITTAAAASIDAKMDDGFPSSGIVQTYSTGFPSNANCTASNAGVYGATTVYNVSYTNQRGCTLVFVSGF